MPVFKISEILRHAVCFVSPYEPGWPIRGRTRYVCVAVAMAVRDLHGLSPRRNPFASEYDPAALQIYRAVKALKAYGMAGNYPFSDLPKEAQPQARVLWLEWVALMCEEDGD